MSKRLVLTRRQLAEVFKDPDAVRVFEAVLAVCSNAATRWGTVAASKATMLVGEVWIEDVAVGANVVAPTGTGTYTLEFLTYGTNLSTAPASKTAVVMGGSGVQGTMVGGNGRVKWTKEE